MEVTDKTFEKEILLSKKPVLIEYWASWCVPCQMMDYVLKELEVDYGDKLKIAKLNIDRNRKTPRKFELTGVPTVMTFKGGNVIETRVGAQSKKNLIQMIERVL
jgi:thioredoxin 1